MKEARERSEWKNATERYERYDKLSLREAASWFLVSEESPSWEESHVLRKTGSGPINICTSPAYTVSFLFAITLPFPAAA